MTISERIINIAKSNNGIITTAMITSLGISRGNLKYLYDSGSLEKSARGIYILPEIWDDEIFNIQSRFKKGIFSHETALFLWDLTDRTPSFHSMTFPSTYNLKNPKLENLHCIQCKLDKYVKGKDTIKTPGGNIVTVYNKERTLCDILRPNSNVDIQLIIEAFKRYSKDSEKNIPLLSEYSKIFKVEKKIRNYLEVLL